MMGCLGMLFVLMYGRNLPFADDWVLVPVVAKSQPFTLGWLWEQQNEHRLPIGRALFLVLGRATGLDVRAGMMVNVFMLTFAAWLCVSSVARARGGFAWSDALYPLILLNWGHWFNLLMCIQIYVVIAVVASVGCFCWVLRQGWRTWSGVAAFGICELLLPLSGGTGLPVATGFAVFAVIVTVVLSRGAGRADRARAAALVGIAMGATALISSYFAGWIRPTFHPQPTWDVSTWRSVMQFLANALGPDGVLVWGVSAGMVAALVVCSLVLLARGREMDSNEKLRRLGLATGIASMAGLAVAVGYSRAGVSENSVLEPRYVTQAVPLLVVLAMVMQLYAKARWLKRVLASGLIALMAANMALGQFAGAKRARDLDAVLRAVQSGRSIKWIAFRHYPKFYPFSEQVAAEYLWLLCESKLGPYADPKFGCDCGELPYKDDGNER